MSDDKKNTGSPDRDRINVNEDLRTAAAVGPTSATAARSSSADTPSVVVQYCSS